MKDNQDLRFEKYVQQLEPIEPLNLLMMNEELEGTYS
jgi:hypothetical protein